MDQKYQSLMENLKRLKLAYIRNNLDELLKFSRMKELSNLEFLNELIVKEVNERDENNIRKAVNKANFPFIKRIEDFDFSFQKSISSKKIKELKDCRWISEHINLIFLGPCGIGKTHLSVGLCLEAIEKGYSVFFSTVDELIRKFYLTLATGDFNKQLQKLLKNDVIVLDELGYLPMEESAANQIFQIVSKAYESKSIIVTSNKSFDKWGQIFKDSAITSAILDRLLHHSEIFVISGNSYRVKDINEKMKKLKDNKK